MLKGFMTLHPDILPSALDRCDRAALDNVRAGRGGPFAASLHVFDTGTRDWVTVAGPVGNAVLETGLASAHAEDRVIAPDHQLALRNVLATYAPGAAHVYVISSAESCPACHAKLEILARQLVAEGKLAPGHFTVVYGASYEDSAAVSGFNDAMYHDDFQLLPGTGMVKHDILTLDQVPEGVRKKLTHAAAHSNGAVAVVECADGLFTGNGAVPEIAAIHMANITRRRQGAAEPWDLGGATLYSTTQEIGPLLYAECQWSHIGRIVSIPGFGPETIEAPGVDNATLFRVIAARPEPHPESFLNFVHIQPFANKAQKEWGKLLKGGKIRSYKGHS